MLVQAIAPLPQGRRSRDAPPRTHTAHSTNTLRIQPGLIVKGARVAHTPRSTQAHRQLPLLSRTHTLATPPVQAHQRQAPAIERMPVTHHEAPSGLGLLRQCRDGPDEFQCLVIQLRRQALSKLQLVPRQRPAGAQRKDQQQPARRPATQETGKQRK